MKKRISLIFLFVFIVVPQIHALTLNTFVNTINPVIPKTYKLNPVKTVETDTSFKAIYEKPGELPVIEVVLVKGKTSFHAMNRDMNGKEFVYQNRQAMFIQQPGLTNYISIILKNEKGLLSFSDMDFKGDKSFTTMVKNIELLNLPALEQ